MDDLARARRCAEIMFDRDTSSQAMDISIDIPAVGKAVAEMTVRQDMLNGFAVCHGGHVFVLADTAFAFACNAYNRETLSVSANIEWLIPSMAGDVLTAVANEDQRDGRHGFYSVEVRNQDDRLVAVFRGHSVSRDKPLFDET